MAKTTAWVFGVIFVIAGLWGFFSQPALGFIAADWVTSLIHLVVGVVLLVVANRPSVVATLKTVGIIYILWAILGFLSVVMSDTVTNWFYLVVGIVVAVLGFMSKNGSPAAAAPQVPPAAPQM